MKKKIELKQEDIKEIDFSKIKNVNFVENTKDKLIIEFEMEETDGKKSN